MRAESRELVGRWADFFVGVSRYNGSMTIFALTRAPLLNDVSPRLEGGNQLVLNLLTCNTFG